MRIQDYETVWDLTDPEEIEAALSTRHGGGRNAFWLSHGSEGFPTISIMVNGDLAYIHYLPERRHPGFSSIGMVPGLPSGEESVFFPSNSNEPLEIMNEQVVRFFDAKKVAQEFAVSAAMPKSIRWFEF
jgi:hypothetical protein